MRPPEIHSSTKEERLSYIREQYKCIADCDSCGICSVFRGEDPESSFSDYIEGQKEFHDVVRRFR